MRKVGGDPEDRRTGKTETRIVTHLQLFMLVLYNYRVVDLNSTGDFHPWTFIICSLFSYIVAIPQDTLKVEWLLWAHILRACCPACGGILKAMKGFRRWGLGGRLGH